MTSREKIWGGPGCGKTTYLMGEYIRLIKEEGYSASDITLTTFRKNAADELAQKVSLLTNKPIKETSQHVGTVHSICNRLANYPEMLEPKDLRQFVKEYRYAPYFPPQTNFKLETDPFNTEEPVYSQDPFDLYNWIRNTDIAPEKIFCYPGIGNIKMPITKIPDFISDYDNFKKKINKVDFSDQIQIVRNKKIKLDTPVLIIDEVQDLTRQQIEVVKMWEPKCEAIVIAGDPLQSIYGFWGGTPEFYLNWRAEEKVLPNSYRLSKPILEMACKILELQGMQPPKIEPNGHKTSKPIILCKFNEIIPGSGESELHLVRCKYQADAIALYLAERGFIFSGLRGWTNREMNLFNAIFNFRRGAPLNASELKALVENYEFKLFNYPGSKKDLIEYLDSDAYKPQLATDQGIITPMLCNILESENPTSKINGCGKLKRLKIEIALRSRKTVITIEETKKIQILTIHGAKGLEADYVFLHTAITPRIRKALLIPGEDSAAEARVWYVGVTRVRKCLFVVKDRGQNYSLPRVVA